MKKLTIYILIGLSILMLNLGTTYAADDTESETSEFSAPIIPKPNYLPGPTPDEQKKSTSRGILIDTILPYFGVMMISFTGGVSLVFLIIGGVRMATSYGNEEAIQKAKDQIKWALIGLGIALLSYTIVNAVIRFEFAKPPSATTPQTSYIEIIV